MMPKLEVHQLGTEEIYRDIARVNECHRVDRRGNRIEEGHVALLAVKGFGKAFLVVRGYEESDAKEIRMDYVSRRKLGIDLNHSYTFDFQRCGWVGQLRWAWSATEIGYQICARLAVVGMLLGLVGLLLGFIGLCRG